MTVDSLKADLTEILASIVTETGSEAIRDPLIKAFDLAIPEDLTPAKTLKTVFDKIRLIDQAFKRMRKTFGDNWPVDSGLFIVDADDPAKVTPYVELLNTSMYRLFDSDNVIESFWFEVDPTAQEKLLPKIPGDGAQRLEVLEISKEVQLYVGLLPLQYPGDLRMPTPEIALRRFAANLELERDSSQHRGMALLQHLDLMDSEGKPNIGSIHVVLKSSAFGS